MKRMGPVGVSSIYRKDLALKDLNRTEDQKADNAQSKDGGQILSLVLW